MDAPACSEYDPEIFFPVSRSWERPYQDAYARSICAGCPLRAACLEENLDVPYGTWGGLTERERKQLRQQRGIPARNMSPFPNESLVLAQRARRRREQEELLGLTA